MPVIGILISKESENDGTIAANAVIEMSSLTPGSIYFAGLSGTITNIPPEPITGSIFVQQIGVALTTNLLLLNLSTNYIERVL